MGGVCWEYSRLLLASYVLGSRPQLSSTLYHGDTRDSWKGASSGAQVLNFILGCEGNLTLSLVKALCTEGIPYPFSTGEA